MQDELLNYMQAANGLDENRLQQFGFCIGAILIWWKIVFLAINPVWFDLQEKRFGLIWDTNSAK